MTRAGYVHVMLDKYGLRKPPDPFYGGVYYDSCAFDGGDLQEQKASYEIRELFKKLDRPLHIVHSVAKEIYFHKTPQLVKDEALNMLQTLEVKLTEQEVIQLNRVELLVGGNSKIENMEADCRHIFEAQKYGRYFVTTDKRILKKAKEIKQEFTLYVFNSSDFLEITLFYYEINKTLT